MAGLLVPLLFWSTVFGNPPALPDRASEPDPGKGAQHLGSTAGPADIEAALAQVDTSQGHDKTRGRVLLVEVSADWCGPCQQLALEVLETPEWAAFVGADLALQVDFESDGGQALKRRYGVLGLPTLLVLGARGVELGRVEGYPGRKEWLEAVEGARAGRVGLEALEREAKTNPDDRVVALRLAQARLLAGRSGALDSLDRLIADAPTDLAAQAARVKGRYFLRAREDAAMALAHFEAMVSRFAGTPHEGHFIYWQANALHHLGRTPEAIDCFVAWRARPGQSAVATAYQADFMVHHALAGAVAVTAENLALTPGAEAHHLRSKALAQAGDKAAARVEAEKACALEPKVALYANHLRGLAP